MEKNLQNIDKILAKKQAYLVKLTYLSLDSLIETNARHIQLLENEIGAFVECKETINNLKIAYVSATIKNAELLIFFVIHENPGNGSEKGRGHLGTELNNKASQVMQIGFEKDNKGNDTDLIRLKCLHARSTKKLEPVYLEYSEEAKGLVLASSDFVAERMAQKKEKATLAEIQSWIQENMGAEMNKEHLMNNLIAYFDCSKRTVEERLKELVESNFLTKEKHGREVVYALTIPF
ncbi:hypothetical protein [Emticicia agri]|uniref:Uncharacterized protein n=1 Tax=Emticicia agri TaxID=2492393 RepID=A0A4Q5LTH1_9BACT|nr:hypothetical protein [Emticicia agri]RYU92713.1 hypothetical protein EWM59_25745 [Emticicia agri]